MSIKWGVLGTASIAKGCTIPGMKEAADLELYAIAGRDKNKVESFQKEFGFSVGYTDYEELLKDEQVQAVYIPLPNSLHYPWVIKALKAGKHVLCEKPLALNEKEAEEMFATAKENGVILAEAYAYLHSPYVKALKEEIESGIIGTPNYIETAFLTKGYKEDIRLHKDLGGGAMYDLGCYCTTMILSLVDSEPVYVKACSENNEEGVDIFTAGIMKFKNGVRASFNVGMMMGDEVPCRWDRLYINGSKGSIRSEVEYNQQGSLTYRVRTEGKEVTKTVEARQNYLLEIEQMNRAIMGLEKQHVTPEFSIRNARLIDMVLKQVEDN